ncbi:hypothetical protein N7532_002737 [Penicillium argentinense]|uniref:Uncharacterized protein n=1 Tax=Penicillium argentinense TaxID=1131581 RepID=A0A9W9G2I6_9EURO|nr:uncharacterized protein N7532_002737 [Penicillium argentinense]KAJ5110092.1 hypothetical protein N7532_002737 [Penicillium argentinense]
MEDDHDASSRIATGFETIAGLGSVSGRAPTAGSNPETPAEGMANPRTAYEYDYYDAFGVRPSHDATQLRAGLGKTRKRGERKAQVVQGPSPTTPSTRSLQYIIARWPRWIMLTSPQPERTTQ